MKRKSCLNNKYSIVLIVGILLIVIALISIIYSIKEKYVNSNSISIEFYNQGGMEYSYNVYINNTFSLKINSAIRFSTPYIINFDSSTKEIPIKMVDDNNGAIYEYVLKYPADKRSLTVNVINKIISITYTDGNINQVSFNDTVPKSISILLYNKVNVDDCTLFAYDYAFRDGVLDSTNTSTIIYPKTDRLFLVLLKNSDRYTSSAIYTSGLYSIKIDCTTQTAMLLKKDGSLLRTIILNK